VALVPASSHSAESLPDEWTVAADGSLTIDGSDDSALLTLRPASQVTTHVELGATDVGDGTGQANLTVTGTNGPGGGLATISANAGGALGGTAYLDGRGQCQLFTVAGMQALQAWDVEGNVLRFALLVAGQPMIAVVAAPADGALSASQVALWFDDSNGVSKLMIKGKSADGTVVTGSVVLV
jgi:hypothetical protein